MGYVNRIAFSARARKLRPCLLGLIVLLASVLWMSCAFLYAAPITFRFDAEIRHIAVGNAIDLPFEFQVGDVFPGAITFEPGNGIPIGDDAIEADQLGEISFLIDGFDVGSSTYSIQVFNNTSVEDSDEFPAFVDTMIIACSPSTSSPCTPEFITSQSGDSFRIGTRLELFGPDSIYSVPEISADPAVWNLFAFRRGLTVAFGNLAGGSMSLYATVGNFALVPEPTTFTAVLWFAVPYLSARSQIRRITLRVT